MRGELKSVKKKLYLYPSNIDTESHRNFYAEGILIAFNMMTSIDNGLFVQNLTNALLKLTCDMEGSRFKKAPKNSASVVLRKSGSWTTGRYCNQPEMKNSLFF